MAKKKNQEKLFEFLNKNKIRYVVTRGFDKESKEKGKDLDILITKRGFERLKEIKPPKINRILHYYVDKESKIGITFVPHSALFRRRFDSKKGFFVLSKRDYRRMKNLRKIIYFGRFIKRNLGIYNKKNKNKIKIIKRNFRMFGLKYVFWDFLYQTSRITYNKIVEKKPKPKIELVKKKVNDYEMYINKNGLGIHRDLYLRGVREPISTEIVKSLIKKEDVTLEAGANIGYYTILESKIVGDKGLVYAIEPIKKSFDILKKNIKLNNLKNVKTFNIGFSDEKKEIKLYLGNDYNSSSPVKTDPDSKIQKIRSTTIDEFFKDKKRKPKFMRMDIEGYEHIILKGAEKTLDNLEIIFIELHFPLIKEKEMINLLKKLKQKNFEIYKGVLEWERLQEENHWLGRFVNYCYKKRSKPIIINDLSIDDLIKSKKILNGHLAIEVFFVKKNLLNNLKNELVKK